MSIHPSAIISPRAELAEDVTVEPFSIIGPGVVIGSGTVVGPHSVIDGNTVIGEKNRIFPFASIGLPPQDLTYRGEETKVVIGNDNVFRENVTVHRGTARGRGVTTIGDGSYFMANSHVAHDCVIGDGVQMANAATIGGHVEVGAHAVIGGTVAIHQFVRIGEYALMGGFSAANMDIAPYMLATGCPARLLGPNVVGLKRNGLSAETIGAIKKFYKIFWRSGLSLKDALQKIRDEMDLTPEVEKLIEFASSSKRGLTR